MKLLTIALLVLLAGCATPSEVRRDGVRFDFTLRLPPPDAVKCIQRNSEEFRGGMIASIRDDSVIVRNAETTVAVAEVRPAGKGSAATIYRHYWVGSATSMHDEMVKGC